MDYNGVLDDARIYNRALTAEEVKELFDMGIINDPPVVDAGTNMILLPPDPVTTVEYDVIVRDDTFPLGTNPRMLWIVEGAPEGATIGFDFPDITTADPCIIELEEFPGFLQKVNNVITTEFTFDTPGFYKMTFFADDTIYTHLDTVRFWVQEEEGDRTMAYWRYEENTPDNEITGHDWRPGIPDDPNTTVIKNEVEGAPPLINPRTSSNGILVSDPCTVPGIHTDVFMPIIPLTGAENKGYLGEGYGFRNVLGERIGTSGREIQMRAANWPGLVFCEDGITIETWLTVGEVDDTIIDQNWTVFDLLDAGQGLEFRNTVPSGQGNIFPPPLDFLLRFEFYVATDVPNEYRRTWVISDVDVLRKGWKHVAFTYDKELGQARVYENGVPAYMTYYYNVDTGTWFEFIPWIDVWQGVPGRTFALPENIDLDVNEFIDTRSGFDELRITAEALTPERLLVKGPTLCPVKINGDLDGDCDVDLADLKLFADSFLYCNSADPADCPTFIHK
jgi:hypothetical protein